MAPKTTRLPINATEIKVTGQHSIFVFDKRGVKQRAQSGGETSATHLVKPGQKVLIHLPFGGAEKSGIVVIPGAGSTVEGSGIEALHKDIYRNTNTQNGFVSEHPLVTVKVISLPEELRKAMYRKVLHTLQAQQ